MAVTKQQSAIKAVAKTTGSELDRDQVLRASKALISKLQSDAKVDDTEAKTNLLADADDDDSTTPVWLVLTTKKHIVDKKRLKPGKITLPHPYIKSDQASAEGLRVCLITADPQRKYKDIVEHPNFPLETSKQIARVIGLEKLKAKYNTYETKRQLLGEYDVFLADDRIITYLPTVLGKVFYKAAAKRPVPVSLEGKRQAFDEQGTKRRKLSEGGTKVQKTEVKPADVAAEIEKALSSALVHLAPSTTTAVKVGSATMPAKHLQDNIEAVVDGLVQTYVPQKWQNVRSIHIKGPNTVALPIWLTDELWTDESKDVTQKALPAAGQAQKKKRKLAAVEDVLEVPGPDGKMRQVTKTEPIQEKKPKETVKENKQDTVVAKPAKRTRMKAADLI